MTKKKMLLTVILVCAVLCPLFAADDWYYNKEIAGFSFSGLINVQESAVSDALYVYRNKPFTDELFARLQNDLYNVPGIDFFSAEADRNEAGDLVIAFEFYEIPMVSAVKFEGNDSVKVRDLREAVTSVTAGMFEEPTRRSVFEAAVEQIVVLYNSRGYVDVPVTYSVEEDSGTNSYVVTFSITENSPVRIVEILFSGNEHINSTILKKQVSSRVKSLFNNGYLNETQLKSDAANIVSYYQTNGYIDVIVSDPIIEYVESSSEKFREATVTFEIDEGLQWFYGGLTVSGNTIVSDDAIRAAQSLKIGSVLNLEAVQNEYGAIADLYYDDGYIANIMNIYDERDDTTMTVRYHLSIVEGPQAVVEEILISGLEKTKDYVMRRELAIGPGDVFSKSKLILSAQNLYNTGLLSNLDYELMYGQTENGVILEFKLEEGNTKDITFGATFGGTLNSFPVSGFVQWTDHNLGGRGQEFGINMTLSPDTQSVDLSFGDSWFGNYRWANSFSFGFSHSAHEGELQLGSSAPEYYNGRNGNKTWPLGYYSAQQWIDSGNEYPATKDLMKYDLFTFSVGYNTGYTFIYEAGRLTLSGGVSVSLNKAVYDQTKFQPYEKLIYQYGLKWQFSNKFSVGIQWDGRDYVTNPTKGYVLGTSLTYAGGLLGGLSNYIKVSGNAAGYLRLFTFTIGEEQEEKNIMLCASTSVNFMLPQFYNYEGRGLRFWDPKYGATRYEMLYIDGMTIGRGFNTVVDQSFLWDNMLEISYVLVKNILQAELFVSATGVNSELSDIRNGINWYYAAGGGIKLKISGFPLGLYLVKNATYKYQSPGDTERTFRWLGGNYFHGRSETSGMSLVLAISTSLI